MANKFQRRSSLVTKTYIPDAGVFTSIKSFAEESLNGFFNENSLTTPTGSNDSFEFAHPVTAILMWGVDGNRYNPADAEPDTRGGKVGNLRILNSTIYSVLTSVNVVWALYG